MGESGWRKSSRSQNGADNCVEVSKLPGAAAVRDSKNPGGPVLVFGSAAFAGFLEVRKHDR
ncbi:DUF397 domain-containing protein [Actinosynnema sp. NPDC050436]|uniref:DUF397 domain-containing protein n=1 Tax=Actinosynnema sp. NPDC050436 TaxID=3155659 RepID=UPI0033EC24E2